MPKLAINRASVAEIMERERKNSIVRAKLESARRVLARAMGVRKAISRKDAERAAVDMMRLVFSAVSANFYEAIIKGIRAKTGESRGGSGHQRNPGILAVTMEALKKSKHKTVNSLWNYLGRNYEYPKEFECKIPIRGPRSCHHSNIFCPVLGVHSNMVNREMKKKKKVTV